MEKELKKKKKWSSWLKILATLSLAVIILLVLWLRSVSLPGHAPGEGLIAFLIPFWYIVVIIGMWVLGFLTRYLIKKELYLIANIISIIGLVVFSIFFYLILVPAIIKPSFFGSVWVFLFASGWTTIPIIYFIISLKLINKARKRV